jgi:hypothetical protein
MLNGAWRSGNLCGNVTKKINEILQKDGSVKRSQWPYFERMNAILSFDDTVRLQYVHEVGAGSKSKLPNEDLKRSCEEKS